MPMEQSSREEFNRAAKTAQKQINETEKKIGDAALFAQNEFVRTLEQISREAMACATAEIERGLKFSKKLSASQSISDAVAAYQEWLSEEMNARSDEPVEAVVVRSGQEPVVVNLDIAEANEFPVPFHPAATGSRSALNNSLAAATSYGGMRSRSSAPTSRARRR